MNVTLNQLRIFLSVVKNESVTRASKELYMTQPAVSNQLKKLQAQFEIPLTEIVGKKIFITDFGKKVADSIITIYEEIERIENLSILHKGLQVGKLSISSASTGKYVMPFFLGDFLSAHENIELKLDVTNRTKVLKSLERNETDFALISLMPEELKINTIALLPNKLYMVAGKDYPVEDNIRDTRQLEDFSFIFRESGSATRMMMEQYLRDNNVSVSKRIELVSNEAAKQAVMAGLGCSIVPIIGIKNELARGELRIISVPHLPKETNWCLVWLKSKKLSPVAEFYLDHLRLNKESLMTKHFGWYGSMTFPNEKTSGTTH